eukprot:scaffold9523_cov103-Cylindrotheca_fusiformis.AAC.3
MAALGCLGFEVNISAVHSVRRAYPTRTQNPSCCWTLRTILCPKFASDKRNSRTEQAQNEIDNARKIDEWYALAMTTREWEKNPVEDRPFDDQSCRRSALPDESHFSVEAEQNFLDLHVLHLGACCVKHPNRKQVTKSSKQLVSSESPSTGWGSLRAPSKRDVQGPRKRHKGLDAPPPLLDYIVVMDFEWTADNKAKMLPIAEITQFPAVIMKLEDRKWVKQNSFSTVVERQSPIALPVDLSIPCFSNRVVNADAFAISAFDTFVRPTLNPILTQFSIDLTGITQDDVNDAPSIHIAIREFVQWLKSLELVDDSGVRKGNWCFATWGDVDIMGTLRQELDFKGHKLPLCFDRWINLKHDSMFKKHYGREPRGGLRKCVESVGAEWSGRAHNGLVDSFNTAKIVRHMVQTGFRFTRPTRGLDRNGLPFGLKKR